MSPRYARQGEETLSQSRAGPYIPHLYHTLPETSLPSHSVCPSPPPRMPLSPRAGAERSSGICPELLPPGPKPRSDYSVLCIHTGTYGLSICFHCTAFLQLHVSLLCFPNFYPRKGKKYTHFYSQTASNVKDYKNLQKYNSLAHAFRNPARLRCWESGIKRNKGVRGGRRDERLDAGLLGTTS